MNNEYPAIGTQVPYLRADDEGNIFDGVGTVMAIYLDPRNRLMVRIKQGQQDYNVDFIGLNYSEDTRKAYQDVIDRVKSVTVEGNEMVKATVASYNRKVDAIYSELLGDPVDVDLVDDSTDDSPDTTTEH